MVTVPLDRNQLDDRARNFYREYLRQSFSTSRVISAHAAEDIVDTPEFARIIAEYGFGSLDSARRIGDMAVIYVDKATSTVPAGETSPQQAQEECLPGAPSPALRETATQKPGEWWRDLLKYEHGQFLQLATTQKAPPWNRPRRGVSALCINFAWNVPELAKRLKSGQPVIDDLRRPITLLFTRSVEGKVVVIEAGTAVEKVFRATNSMRTTPQIAEAAGMSLIDTEKILTALAGVGAVIPAKSASEMLEAIQSRENRPA
jgi:hypothetical protein